MQRIWLAIIVASLGWGTAGVPTRAKLEELGLGWVADQLSASNS